MPKYTVTTALLALMLAVIASCASIEAHSQASPETRLVMQESIPCYSEAVDIGDAQIVPCQS